MPGVIESVVDVLVHKYSVSVLSRWVAKIYGCEYESVVSREPTFPSEELGIGDEVPEDGVESTDVEIDENP